jgi:hypothetical protein
VPEHAQRNRDQKEQAGNEESVHQVFSFFAVLVSATSFQLPAKYSISQLR